ncbi:hypothetical protein BH11PSE9_BH11PSE9_14920 [soil metagenome]
MYLVAIAWIYVVLMMAVAEATNSNGTVLGAVVTFVLYGVLPLAIVLYLMASPARRKALRRKELAEEAAARAAAGEAAAKAGVVAVAASADGSAGDDPDRGGHAAGDAIAPVRKEP